MKISEQIVQVGLETERTRPKSDSEGTGVLDSLTMAVLRAHLRQQQDERAAWDDLWVDSGHVFTDETGEPLHPDFVSRHFVRLVRWANELRLGSQGQAVRDIQAALGATTSGVFGKETRQAVIAYQQAVGAPAAGVVDPHLWYRLFPDQPLRSYPHAGHLPPIRLNDLRHCSATLPQPRQLPVWCRVAKPTTP